jgi:hypothetical protein
MQVEGEEYKGRHYRIKFHTDGFLNRGEAVDNIQVFPETIQGSDSYEREEQKEIQTHELTQL